MTYGGGSIKKNGLYDAVTAEIKKDSLENSEWQQVRTYKLWQYRADNKKEN